jgi:hypothetical protein
VDVDVREVVLVELEPVVPLEPYVELDPLLGAVVGLGLGLESYCAKAELASARPARVRMQVRGFMRPPLL